MGTKKMMKAVSFNQYGGPEVLKYGDVPIPDIGPDEVLIKVAATAVNPADAYIRAGVATARLKIEFPFIPGVEVSGIIEETGESVKGFKAGDRVFGFLDFAKSGGAAEYVAVRADYVHLAPKNIPLQDAAAIPATGLCAWQALFEHGNLQAGQRVLITNAAGGVGSLAVQLAKWKGAYVIGTASERNFSALKIFGVDEIVDYKNETIEGKVKTPLDLLFTIAPDGTEAQTRLLSLLKRGGTHVAATHPADEARAKELGVKTLMMGTQHKDEQLAEIARLVDEGHLKPFITERLPLSNLAAAHEKAGQTPGKALIVVDSAL